MAGLFALVFFLRFLIALVALAKGSFSTLFIKNRKQAAIEATLCVVLFMVAASQIDESREKSQATVASKSSAPPTAVPTPPPKPAAQPEVAPAAAKATPSPPPPPSSPPPQPSTPGSNPTLPWLADAEAACKAVQGAANDIQKNKLYRNFEKVLRGARLSGIKGTLAGLNTTVGGDEVESKVLVRSPQEVSFFNAANQYPIRRGSKPYKALEDMREGQCVVFSSDKVMPTMTKEVEEAMAKAGSDLTDPSLKVLTTTCRTDGFGVRFTDIQACK